MDHNKLGPPDKIKWLINGTEIDFKLHKGGINIQSFKRRLSTTSKLTILNFQHEDAGSYECRNVWITEEANDPSTVSLR